MIDLLSIILQDLITRPHDNYDCVDFVWVCIRVRDGRQVRSKGLPEARNLYVFNWFIGSVKDMS